MERQCNVYTTEDINRFVDNELPLTLYHNIEEHLNLCQDCKRLAADYKTISAVLIDHVQQEILKIDPARIEQKLSQVLETSKPKEKYLATLSGFFEKNIYLTLSSLAAILMISLYAFQGDHAAGPSAIVKSVDTDFASVMIIETQKEQHTIIWFSET